VDRAAVNLADNRRQAAVKGAVALGAPHPAAAHNVKEGSAAALATDRVRAALFPGEKLVQDVAGRIPQAVKKVAAAQFLRTFRAKRNLRQFSVGNSPDESGRGILPAILAQHLNNLRTAQISETPVFIIIACFRSMF
jgi:regulator of protease activity HflC (stomatin/prohibitin superfamily)